MAIQIPDDDIIKQNFLCTAIKWSHQTDGLLFTLVINQLAQHSQILTLVFEWQIKNCNST
jgi:hypothetical protein